MMKCEACNELIKERTSYVAFRNNKNTGFYYEHTRCAIEKIKAQGSLVQLLVENSEQKTLERLRERNSLVGCPVNA